MIDYHKIFLGIEFTKKDSPGNEISFSSLLLKGYPR